MAMNGTKLPPRPAADQRNGEDALHRADEADDLLEAVKESVVKFIRAADEDALTESESQGPRHLDQGPISAILEQHPPQELQQLLSLSLPDQGQGKEGFLRIVEDVHRYSVNTWHQGFMDKLYASITPVGLASDLLLSSLNTNLHVYQVSPALTVIEKTTARALASIFGLKGRHAGGVSQPGGSAANQSSMVIARNNLFPDTKTRGYEGKGFVVSTSAHGHYSVEKSAQMLGFGSGAVRSVALDAKGRMRPDALEEMIEESKRQGETPFYVNATAGTTVLGSFDPLDQIADVCRRHKLWLHVDGSWGGPVVFSAQQRHKLKGIERADSITICPHKMMNVPLTCSFLLGKDLREFHKGMTLPAGYLFHNNDDSNKKRREANGANDHHGNDVTTNGTLGADANEEPEDSTTEIWDLADLTPQCGRRGDSLKLALSWIYYGTSGLAAYIDGAFDIAAYLAHLISTNPNFSLVSEKPPPCLQVCFYFGKQSKENGTDWQNKNSKTTEEITKALIPKGFMTDYAPGEDGKFFRVVVNGQTRRGTVEALIRAIESIGETIRP